MVPSKEEVEERMAKWLFGVQLLVKTYLNCLFKFMRFAFHPSQLAYFVLF